MLLRFETIARQTRLILRIEAKFRTFWPPVKLVGGEAICEMFPCYFVATPRTCNHRYTFDGAPLRRLAAMTVRGKKVQRLNIKASPTNVGVALITAVWVFLYSRRTSQNVRKQYFQTKQARKTQNVWRNVVRRSRCNAFAITRFLVYCWQGAWRHVTCICGCHAQLPKTQ